MRVLLSENSSEYHTVEINRFPQNFHAGGVAVVGGFGVPGLPCGLFVGVDFFDPNGAKAGGSHVIANFHVVILSGPVGAYQNLIFWGGRGILEPSPQWGPEGGKLTAGAAGGGEASARYVKSGGRRFLLFRRWCGAGDVLDTLQHLLRREALRL